MTNEYYKPLERGKSKLEDREVKEKVLDKFADLMRKDYSCMPPTLKYFNASQKLKEYILNDFRARKSQ